jgi:hypothetical protein
MVIGLFLITAIPTVTGLAQAISAQKEQKQREKDAERMLKFHIDVTCDARAPKVKEIDKHRLVLKDDRVWLGPVEAQKPCSAGYVVQAFYIEYPDNERDPIPLGLVSQVADNPPLMNWIYVDKHTMELRYGNKTASIAHHVGPWDWTEDKEGIIFDKEDALFMAVLHPAKKKWQLYYDIDGDDLQHYVPQGRQKLQIMLRRILIPGT